MDSESNYHHHEAVSSNRKKLVGTLTSPSFPTLPFDLIPEILSRLPVKLLVQFRCVCKSWNSLITDTKFAKKHLRLSTTSIAHTLTYSFKKYVLKSYSYPFDTVFSDVTANPIAHLKFPFSSAVYFAGSCNGILCFLSHDHEGFLWFQLWNPSIRKFKELPPLGNQIGEIMYGFGYDAVTNNYKVVVVLRGHGDFFENNVVKVHTLGTCFWKSIQKFPFVCDAWQRVGKCVSGTINWLVAKKYDEKIQHVIVSLDLGNESYKEVLLPPDYGAVDGYIDFHLGVLRDCLCMVFGQDVWVMKEYGNKDSWTKLFTISTSHANHADFAVVNVFQGDQVLLMSIKDYTLKLIFYNFRNDNLEFKLGVFEATEEVCVESLISPCSS